MSKKVSQYPRPPITTRPRVIVSRETSTAHVINDALSILAEQIQLLKVKSNFGQTLETDDQRNLRTMVQSVLEIQKNEREQEKHEGVEATLAALTPEELFKIAQGEGQGQITAKSEAKEPTE